MAGFISLADAKVHLRVDTADQDEEIQRLVDAASMHVERMTGYVAVTREESFHFDRFTQQLELRLRPIDAETIAVTYLDGNGDAQPFTDIRVISFNDSLRVLPAIGFCWPATACVPGAISVSASVGFGATVDDGAVEAPDTVKHAVRLLIANWYDKRDGGDDLPEAVEHLLDDDRLRRV